jgi:hypothetical protein
MNDQDALVRSSRQLLREGKNIEVVLGFLRNEGCTIVDSIKLTKLVTGMSLGAAKELVHASQTWSDRREAHDQFHDALEGAVENVVTVGRGRD